ncbi:auxin efflux carrier [Micractinium conductrix]|uniref:Auxin efflux carrier n=1 Tax=Micractinium conductrix TaxID=554055 RepID=A0A2P6VMV8_9CHLO|nr:auxin efflux carrier [Micractinium conductrix]|eukprot:PSC75420.1 auxin efflux carrier [Micractinium conductrix]
MAAEAAAAAATAAAAAAAAGTTGLTGWALLSTAAAPTLIVCLLGAVGAAMAHRGVLNEQGCAVVSRLIYYVYIPALTFSKLAQAVTLSSIAHLWPLLANMTISILFGLALGAALARLLRCPLDLRFLVVISCAFSNVGNLPLVFVSALCHDQDAMFYRALGEECEHRGEAYTGFDIAAATLWQFSVAISIIRRAAAARAAAAEAAALDGSGSCAVRAAADGDPISLPVCAIRGREPTLSDLLQVRGRSRSGSAGNSTPREQPPPPFALAPRQQLGASPSSPRPAQLLPSPFGRGQAGQRQQQQRQQHAAGVELQQVALQPHPQHRQQHHPQQPPWPGWATAGQEEQPFDGPTAAEDTASLLGHKGSDAAEQAAGARKRGGGSLARAGRAAWRYLRGVDWGAAFPLPAQAAILGIAVGCVPPLKGLIYAPHPPLRVLREALDTLGNGLLPANIPLLGAVLYRGPGESHMPLRVTVGILVMRLALMPALMTALVWVALKLQLFVPPDSMFLLTLLMSNATPTAVSLQTMAVLFNAAPAETASILFIQYLACVVTLPCWSWVFLQVIHAQ